MNLDRLDELETIDPRQLPPWRAEALTDIEIESYPKTARESSETIRSMSNLVVYSD
jgi:hypothetical protein